MSNLLQPIGNQPFNALAGRITDYLRILGNPLADEIRFVRL
ncbi:MAG: hypothetical protein Q8J74_10950 [Candidatus Didemnitutus sp.]|nr:hypothetical protein [Candidatus Didemnitutus sp.]